MELRLGNRDMIELLNVTYLRCLYPVAFALKFC